MKNNIENTEAFQIANERVKAEKQRQYDTLHNEPPQDFRGERAGEAFNLGFPSTQAMDEEISKHPKVFMEISTLATKKIIGYEEAEKELRKVNDPNLILKVKKYQNLKNISKIHKKEPGPPRIYINKHKSRPKTKNQVIQIYERWKTQKALNAEKPTPLDEYPEFTW